MSIDPSRFEVRSARPEERDQVVPLLIAQLREHEIPVSEAHVSRKVEQATMTGEVVILLALLDARSVGVAYVSFAEPLEHEGTVAWLEELYVVPEHREHGIGGKLLAAVVALAEERGCVAVELETKRGHERAGHLYVRHGFHDLSRRHYARPLARWDWPLPP
jgi:GNAT superfamily N-acetyltransferase